MHTLWSVGVVVAISFAPTGELAPDEHAEQVVFGIDLDAFGVDREHVTRVLQGHLAGTRFVVVVVPRDEVVSVDAQAALVGEQDPERGPIAAILWVDREVGGDRLHLRLPGQSGSWSRELEEPEGAEDPDVLLESLGVIVRGMVPVIPPSPPVRNTAPALPPTPEQLPPRQPTPTPGHVPPTPATVFDLELGYQGESLASDALWQSGLQFAGGVETPRGLTAGVGVGWFPRMAVATTLPTTVQRIPVELALGVRLRRSKALRPEVGALLVGEALGWSVEDADRFSGRAGWGMRLGLGVRAGARWQVWRGLFVFARARAIAWPVNVDLVSEAADGRAQLLRPHPVVGSFSAGVGYRFGS